MISSKVGGREQVVRSWPSVKVVSVGRMDVRSPRRVYEPGRARCRRRVAVAGTGGQWRQPVVRWEYRARGGYWQPCEPPLFVVSCFDDLWYGGEVLEVEVVRVDGRRFRFRRAEGRGVPVELGDSFEVRLSKGERPSREELLERKRLDEAWSSVRDAGPGCGPFQVEVPGGGLVRLRVFDWVHEVAVGRLKVADGRLEDDGGFRNDLECVTQTPIMPVSPSSGAVMSSWEGRRRVLEGVFSSGFVRSLVLVGGGGSRRVYRVRRG